MSVSTELVLAIIGGASTITTAIFWGAYSIGKYANRIDMVEKRVDAHDEILQEYRGMAR